MKQATPKIKTLTAIFIMAIVIAFSSCGNKTEGTGNDTATNSTVDSLRNQILALTKNSETISGELVKFDTLDFTVFSDQQ